MTSSLASSAISIHCTRPSSIESFASVDTIKRHPVVSLSALLDARKAQFKEQYEKIILCKETKDDYEFLAFINEGSYNDIYLVKKKESDNLCAMKTMRKRKIIDKKQTEFVVSEVRILKCLRFPFIISLVSVFMDNSYIYCVTPYLSGGSIYSRLKQSTKFSEDQAKFYAGQVLLGVEYIHFLDLVHRDLKPENVMIDRDGNIKIIDFGFCKLIKSRSYTLCGTPEYIPPEMILQTGYGRCVDYWSYGILIHEMVTGYTPFVCRNELKMYDNIAHGKVLLQKTFTKELKDLLAKLIVKDITKRIGNLKDGINDIKNHSWFKEINWLALLNCHVKPPYLPSVPNLKDPTFFNKHDLKPANVKSLHISDEDLYKKHFKDFF